MTLKFLHFKKAFTLLFVISASFLVVATSKDGGGYKADAYEQDYYIQSDCDMAAVSQFVTLTIQTATKVGVISSPSTLAFSDFGFPVDNVPVGGFADTDMSRWPSVSGQVNGEIRQCRVVYLGSYDDRFTLYSCFDDVGDYLCTIEME